jgi:hypothetical protein
MQVLKSGNTLMLNNFPKAKADVELFVIKLAAGLRKSGKDPE